MLVRVTWLGLGVAAGLGASKWLERKLRRKVANLMPAPLAQRLTRGAEAKARSFLAEVREALEEGRAAMARRELELKQRLPAPVPDPSVLSLETTGGKIRGQVIEVGAANEWR